MAKLSISIYSSLRRVLSHKALCTLLLVCLGCIIMACNKDDDDDYSSASMSLFYAESRDLCQQDLDSITLFKQKFCHFMALYPQAKSNRYYIKINARIAYSIKNLNNDEED